MQTRTAEGHDVGTHLPIIHVVQMCKCVNVAHRWKAKLRRAPFWSEAVLDQFPSLEKHIVSESAKSQTSHWMLTYCPTAAITNKLDLLH